jgi:hypothetical protein
MPTPQTEYRTKAAVAASAKARFNNLTGKRFGGLLAICRLSGTISGQTPWLCACDCDPTKAFITSSSRLLSGDTSSCGCLKKELLALRRTTHGHTKGHKFSAAYTCWANMVTRCTNPKDKRWKDYGGRGIKVCDEWRVFIGFYAAMGDPPEGLTLDRKNNDGNYEKDNCQWATDEQQARNKRMRVDNKTGCVGVTIANGTRYRASAKIDGRQKHLGYFPLSPEGLKAADEAVKKAKRLRDILS